MRAPARRPDGATARPRSWVARSRRSIPAACFLTPDGQLWNAESSILRRFVDGRWVDVEAATDPRGVRRADWNGLDLRLGAINDTGPPGSSTTAGMSMLLRLAYGPGFKDPRLELIPLTEAGRRLKVRDAIAWTKGELLLATDRGLADLRDRRRQDRPRRR